MRQTDGEYRYDPSSLFLFLKITFSHLKIFSFSGTLFWQEVSELFNEHAQLAQLGIIDARRIQAIIANPAQFQHHSRSLLRAVGVEVWLRTLAEQPIQNTSHRPHRPSVGQYSAPSAEAKKCEVFSGLAQLKEHVVAYEINGQIVLFHHQSLDVSRLNGTGTIIWQALMQETTWSSVINRIHQSSLYADTFEETEKLVHTFVQSLCDEGWITLVSEERRADVFSTDNGDDLPPGLRNADST
jgi:hypothetical protein